MDKAGWRRRAREDIPPDPVDPAPFVEALARFLLTAPPGWIVTYRALAHEVDVSGLEARPGVGPFALTRTPAAGRELTVHAVGGEVERHRWGFDQPTPASPRVPLGSVAVVLVPGLAFDRRGNRLGHGGGFYDRLLAKVPGTAWRVGVARSEMVVDRLPVEGHDVPMTHLATEAGVVRCPDPLEAG